MSGITITGDVLGGKGLIGSAKDAKSNLHVDPATTNTYASARSGLSKSLVTSGVGVGQTLDVNWDPAGQTYYNEVWARCWQIAVSFPLAGLGDYVMETAQLKLLTGTDESTVDFTIESFLRDWGATLDTGDFIPGATLGTLVRVGSLATSGLAFPATFALDGSVLLDAVKSPANRGTYLRLIVASSRQRVGTCPPYTLEWAGGAEHVEQTNPEFVRCLPAQFQLVLTHSGARQFVFSADLYRSGTNTSDKLAFEAERNLVASCRYRTQLPRVAAGVVKAYDAARTFMGVLPGSVKWTRALDGTDALDLVIPWRYQTPAELVAGEGVPVLPGGGGGGGGNPPPAGSFNVMDYGAVGDKQHDDTQAFQDCIDAAGANGVIYIPFPSVAYLLTGVVVPMPGQTFQGDYSTIYMAADGTYVGKVIFGLSYDGLSFDKLTFASDVVGSPVYSSWVTALDIGTALSNLSLTNVTFTNLRYGLKGHKEAACTNLHAQYVYSTGCTMTIQGAKFIDPIVEDFDFAGIGGPKINGHNVYWNEGCYGGIMRRGTLRDSDGYGLQFFNDDASDPSHDFLVEDVTLVDCYKGVAICAGCYNIHIDGFAGSGLPGYHPWFSIQNATGEPPYDILVENFAVVGGGSLLGDDASQANDIGAVVFQNGTYKDLMNPPLVQQAARFPDLTMTNIQNLTQFTGYTVIQPLDLETVLAAQEATDLAATPSIPLDSWHNVDLSGLIPADTQGVALLMVNSAATARNAGVRKPGLSLACEQRLYGWVRTLACGGIAPDANGAGQYISLRRNNTAIKFYLVGAFGTGAVFLNASTTFAPGATGWTDIDLSTVAPNDPVLAGIFWTYNATAVPTPWMFAMRPYGSTDFAVMGKNVREDAYTYICPTDAAKRCQQYAENITDQFVVCIGYVRACFTAQDPATDLAPTADANYHDLPALRPVNAVAGLYEAFNAAGTARGFALRTNGEADDIYYVEYAVSQAIAGVDADGIVECKLENADCKVMLRGTFEAV